MGKPDYAKMTQDIERLERRVAALEKAMGGFAPITFRKG